MKLLWNAGGLVFEAGGLIDLDASVGDCPCCGPEESPGCEDSGFYTTYIYNGVVLSKSPNRNYWTSPGWRNQSAPGGATGTRLYPDGVWYVEVATGSSSWSYTSHGAAGGVGSGPYWDGLSLPSLSNGLSHGPTLGYPWCEDATTTGPTTSEPTTSEPTSFGAFSASPQVPTEWYAHAWLSSVLSVVGPFSTEEEAKNYVAFQGLPAYLTGKISSLPNGTAMLPPP
jgi:hypothetical protein